MRRRFMCTLIVSAAVCLSYVLLTFNEPPFPLERLNRLSPAMTERQVQDVLGAPSYVYPDGRTWSYSRALAWPMVSVYFDADGRFVRAEYDH